MNEHDEIRKLLAQVAAGVVSPADLRKVNEHIPQCESCRLISEDFAALASGLRRLTTPQPRAEIVARVRDMAESRLVAQPARGREAAMLAPLVAAAWILALATWPLTLDAGRWVLAELFAHGRGIGAALAVYSVLGFLLACAAVLAVGRRAGAIGRVR